MNCITEAEAKKKWCPYSMTATDIRTGEASRASMCIASGCMAWRWYYPPDWDTEGQLKALNEQTGYCGAFGS